MTKNFLLNIALTALCDLLCWGQKLPLQQIPAQAKWVVHFDAERFRASQMGQYFTNNLLADFAQTAKAKLGFDFKPLADTLKSATAFGWDSGKRKDDNGVLMLRCNGAELKNLESFLAAKTGEKAEKDSMKVEMVADTPIPMFRIEREVFAASLPDGTLLLSKSKSQTITAWEVLKGELPALKPTAFGEVLKPMQGFLAVAVMGGFETAAIIPQAKLLQSAKGFGLTIGENEEDLHVDLMLKLENEEVATQIKAIAQGLLAWAAMDKSMDKNARMLLQSVRLGSKGSALTATFELPVADVIAHLNEETKRKRK